MGAEAKMMELIGWIEEDLCFIVPGVILARLDRGLHAIARWVTLLSSHQQLTT